MTVTGGSSGNGGGIANFGTLTVTNSTILGNSADSRYGGGIYSHRGTLTVTNSIISNNSAQYGGGIYNFQGTVAITASVINDNSVLSGGGIYSIRGAVTITTSTISGNSATAIYTAKGGAIVNAEGKLTVIDSVLEGNSAVVRTVRTDERREAYGGAIYSSGTLTVANSTLTRNWAVAESSGYKGYAYVYGGAIYSQWTLTVTNSTLVRNWAIAENPRNSSQEHAYGGGIFADPGRRTIVNSNLIGNSVTGRWADGGGICSGRDELTVANSIVAMNHGEDIAAILSDESSNNLIGIDPRFVRNPSDGGDGWGDDPSTPDINEGANDDYGDLRLLPDSPAIDAGDNALVPEGVLVDLNGNPRIWNGTVDMGAYEYLDTALLHPGDANFDGVTDLSDFNIWNAYKFTDNAAWATGDFNGDRVTDLSDFNIWNAYKFTSAAGGGDGEALDPPPEAGADSGQFVGELGWVATLRQNSGGPSQQQSLARAAVDLLLASYWG